MFLLLFFVFLIQSFTYWIFEPFASFLEYVLEIRLFHIIALIVFAENNKIKPTSAMLGNNLISRTCSKKDARGSYIQ